MGDGRGLLAKVLSSWRWCPWGSRALLVGNMLLLFLLYIAHFQRELGHREALEAAVQDLQQELSSTTKSLQDARNQVMAISEKSTRHQLDAQLCEKRNQDVAKQMEEIRQQERKLRLAEEEKDKRLRSCSEDLESSLVALNISREQQAASAQAERCCTSVPMCNLCLMRR
ncbi:unnamed protein product [Symbiodinium necroappetens]|uniref:Uncharacterized protein n=2 Tax=Symbiodinium TaxID=2949 RepID=A0A812PTW9_9DINO|nr:hypothetical protein AK812_SmicGene37868 [Symbiodinium microadriaticum]CAE7355348.1 unnamed protein product [Symbiodinium necroappetens]CAE7604417.1 unnamed protein product [Symbiodinium microadriaticum]CAE7904406.1 unnamed protein product [Symbiodinium sp. KB8]